MEEDEDKSMDGSEGEEARDLDELMAELRDSDRKLPQYPQVSEWQDDNIGVEEEKDPHGKYIFTFKALNFVTFKDDGEGSW
jgi:hypothetical protein